ncbi:MAG: hypothetical protein JRH20_15560, partial [Deltaproteobacteria bacterium]|nr:hypothetical protein [Deltaproteobacteria bacterium]
FPAEERDLSLEAGTLNARLSSDGGDTLVAAFNAGKTPLTLKIDGKKAISALFDRDGQPWTMTLAPWGSETTLTLDAAVKPSVEIYPEVFDGETKPLTNPSIEGELSAGLSVRFTQDSPTLLEVLNGSATLKSGDTTLQLSAGQCLLEADPPEVQSFLDVMQAGSCLP